jgi:MerR family transcriptional regulator, light-induced transcriptional regulator
MEEQFGKWLRYYRKRNGMSQKEVADRIGVGQTTIANYETNNRFPDRQKLVALSRLFNASLDELLGVSKNLYSGQGRGKGSVRRPTVDRAIELLISGREDEAWQRIEEVISEGTPLASLYGELFQPVLEKTGLLWASGELTVAQEHLISYRIESFMERARLFYPRQAPRGLTCVCAAVPGEQHGIGLRMFRDLLELRGWATFFLGTNIPTDQFIRFVSSFPVDLVALTLMLDSNIDSARLMIDQLRRTPATGAIPILLGGGVFAGRENPVGELGVDGLSLSMAQGVEEAERLAAAGAGGRE